MPQKNNSSGAMSTKQAGDVLDVFAPDDAVSGSVDSKPQKITDPDLLKQLNDSPKAAQRITDPELLNQLNGSKSDAGMEQFPSESRAVFEKGMQGATFGFSDEIMDRVGAMIASKYTGQPYADVLKEARSSSQSRLKKEQEQYPVASTVAEMAGGLAVPGIGAAKLLPEAAKASKLARIASGAGIGAGQGALMGAGQAEEGKRVEGAKTGGEFGAAGGAIGTGIVEPAVAAVAPKFSKAVELLRDAGIKMTPGQLAKGSADVIKRTEDFLKGVPIVGGMVRGGLEESIKSFNKAIINKSLTNVGEKLPDNVDAGRDAIAYAERAIGDKYDKLLPKLSFQMDSQVQQEIATFNSTVKPKLPESQQKQLDSIWDSIVKPRLDQNSVMTGDAFKNVESELSYEAKSYAHSPNPADRRFAEAVSELQGILKENLARMNPKYAKELSNINTSWAMFSRARGASINRATSNGVFSPADLLQDIKRSSSKSVFARGDGLMQDLADAANTVLPTALQDSGTVERGLWAALLGTGGAALAPKTAAAGIAASLPYTRGGMAVVNKIANPSPTRITIRKGLTPYTPAAGVIGSDLSNYLAAPYFSNGNQ